MIDIHSHMMFQVDDGSKDLEESLEMLKEAQQAGFTDIILTPHFNLEYNTAGIHTANANLDHFKAEALRRGIAVRLHVGAEIFITPELPALIQDQKAPALQQSRYVLFELPFHSKILYLEEVVSQLKRIGKVPVLAHPERYRMMQEKPEHLMRLREQGVLFQCNYGSIIGHYGNTAKKTVKKLLKQDMVHFLATDCHRRNSVYCEMPEIQKKLLKVIRADKLDLLSRMNPGKILADVPL